MDDQKELYINLTKLLNCKDNTVSGDYFEVMANTEYEMLVTSPVPKNIEDYYKSEAYISHSDSKKTFFDKSYQVVKNHTLKQKLYY